ncbi:right-handed parallel beta-helix repeat-containing protein [Streptomyces durhamensis]|uniref:right-handed parallel beta-helix repeat-containing protein n=1 Tax=Streptomyces durhamensis TaxID=68194 RepID=UPI0004CCF909|nr:right-handed parallel beta-helix repeat-containing protein [Streptomyces durhamensis]
MTKRHIPYVVSSTVVLGAFLGATPASAAHPVHVVHPGESIQQAVDAARSGDTVLVQAGTYHESVKVTTSGITLRGVGPATVLEPAAPKAASTAQATKTMKATRATQTPQAPKSCAEQGNGICVVGTKTEPVRNVTVADLAVTGFSRIGVVAVGADGLTVRGVTADRNGQWGIAEERSTRSVYRNDTARSNGDAGLFLANTISAEQGATDTGGTVLDHNRLADNRIGITVRRLRNLTVKHNVLTGNCAGLFVVGDENKPKAGALTVSHNLIEQNDKYCAATARLPFLQGSGIILTGADDTLVTHNLVSGNSGASPLSGGIVLFKSFVGATSERNRITANSLAGNGPADLVNQEAAKSSNIFQRNLCRASKPAGLC